MSVKWTITNMKQWYIKNSKINDDNDYWANVEKKRTDKLREEIMSDEPYIPESAVYSWIVSEMEEHDDCRKDPKSELICELIQVIADTIHNSKHLRLEIINEMREFFNSLPKKRKLRK